MMEPPRATRRSSLSLCSDWCGAASGWPFLAAGQLRDLGFKCGNAVCFVLLALFCQLLRMDAARRSTAQLEHGNIGVGDVEVMAAILADALEFRVLAGGLVCQHAMHEHGVVNRQKCRRDLAGRAGFDGLGCGPCRASF